MKIPAWTWVILIILIIAGGWYWFATTQSAGLRVIPTSQTPSEQTGVNGSPNQGNLGQPSSSSTPQKPQGDGSNIADNLTLGVDSSASLGKYLIAYNGMTLYTYAKDHNATSTCYGQCAQVWPPYTIPTGMHLNLQMYVTGSASTITRADGTTQVTYNGKPLYFYTGDAASGQTNGQGIGGVWYVVKP